MRESSLFLVRCFFFFLSLLFYFPLSPLLLLPPSSLLFLSSLSLILQSTKIAKDGSKHVFAGEDIEEQLSAFAGQHAFPQSMDLNPELFSRFFLFFVFCFFVLFFCFLFFVFCFCLVLILILFFIEI